MLKSLLSNSQKEKIINLISRQDFVSVIKNLDSLKTEHAQTARMLDKRFTIAEIVKFIENINKDKTDGQKEKAFYIIGKKICSIKSDNAKEVGVHIIWRAYNYNKKAVEAMLMKIADDLNWEVREYAASAAAATVANYSNFYTTLEKWRSHKSENVRRVVVMSAAGLKNKKDPSCTKRAFALLEPLLYDSSVYVKKNLGPFAIGSWFGYSFPKETFAQLDKWVKKKDANVRWNAAMAFNNSFGNHYPEKALKYLKILSSDKNKTVRRAVISTLRTLRKRHADLINDFVNKTDLKI
jgi:hypothetical protein